MTPSTGHLPPGRPDSGPASLNNSPHLSPYLQAAPSSSLSIASSFASETSESTSRPKRRRLLVVYIHGFYGNDESFRSFPAHVHDPLKELLRETHFVHSKIYPRYKTYKAIEVGRDAFCEWLRPHTDDNTDVVLVGHSMGGILAAEIALKTTPGPYGTDVLENHILGIVALDTPFLGMHHGIIVSGLSSLFSEGPILPEPFEEPPSTEPFASSSALEMQPQRRTDTSIFNPSFVNDIRLKTRSFKESLAHFAHKHKPEGLFQATKAHIWNHLQYCSCLLDYPGLRARYNRIRALEDVDMLQSSLLGKQRVRFVNYYTTCDGRPATPKTKKEGSKKKYISRQLDTDHDGPIASATRQSEDSASLSLSPASSNQSALSESSCTTTDPPPSCDPVTSPLPPIPAVPVPPMCLSSAQLATLDKPARKEIKQKHAAERKAYKIAVKAYLRASKAHTKALEKETTLSRQRDTQTLSTATNTTATETSAHRVQAHEKDFHHHHHHQQPRKERKFCVLPVDDRTWVKVFMHDVDEVGAHCGLFLPGRHYEPLLGDVAVKISAWVQEDMTRREVLRLREAGEGA